MPEIKVDIVNCIRVQTRQIRLTLDINNHDREPRTIELDEDCVCQIDQACANLEWLVECLEGLPPVGNSDLQAIEALMKERVA